MLRRCARVMNLIEPDRLDSILKHTHHTTLGRFMALLFFLLAVALTWCLGALHLWPRMRWTRELPLWLGGVLAVGAAACIAWGFAGIFRRGDWHSLTMDQAVHRVAGPGSMWFQGTGWPLLDRITGIYGTLDLVLNLVVLSAVAMHGYVFWTGVAQRRRQARLRAQGPR